MSLSTGMAWPRKSLPQRVLSMGCRRVGEPTVTFALASAYSWINSTGVDAPLANSTFNKVMFVSDGEPTAWTTVFVITLNPASTTYSVDMNDVVDSTTRVDFNAGAFAFVGGNNEWAEFIPAGETVSAPIDNNSSDLLLTPQINHQFASSINSNCKFRRRRQWRQCGSTSDIPRRFCNGSSGQSCKYGPRRLWCLEQAGSCF